MSQLSSRSHSPFPPIWPDTVVRQRLCRPADVRTAILISATAVAAWPIFLALRAPVPIQLSVVVAHVAGMLTGFGVVVMVGLMSRAPALELGVGADRLARWHSRGGRAVVLLMLLHAWAAVQAWSSSRGESGWLALWHILRLPWLIAATIGTVLFLLVAGLSIRAARRRVSHELWHSVHLLLYVAVALSFVHQLAGPDLAGYRVLQVMWALLYTGVFALVVQYRVLAPLRNANLHRMRVQAVVPEGNGVVSVIVRGNDLHLLQSQSGQFFRWRFLTPDLWKTAHPFSLSAAPTPTHLRLTVKALGDGSSRLQQLEAGTWVLAEGPYGAITADRRTQRNVLLIAGGVGITPMRALFESLPAGPDHDVLLLYKVRTAADIIFRGELDQIANRSGARVQYLLDEHVPRVTSDVLLYLVPDLRQRDVYLCGPPGFATAIRQGLRAGGLPSGQLHEERFDL